MPSIKIQNLALSVRQPFAEQIKRDNKKIEYRSLKTNICSKVYINVSKHPCIDCIEENGEHHLLLASPKQLNKLMVPENRPSPVWFNPFKKLEVERVVMSNLNSHKPTNTISSPSGEVGRNS